MIRANLNIVIMSTVASYCNTIEQNGIIDGEDYSKKQINVVQLLFLYVR
jgi:hypothetical protein